MSRAQQASDRAAAWIIAREDGDWTDAQQAEFEAWLAEADGNKAAYWRLKQSWKEADRIGALRDGGGETGRHFHRSEARRWWLPAAIAASILAMVGAGMMVSRPAVVKSRPIATIAYDTPVGGRRLVGLADGSKVQLNTASLMRTSISEERREVWLDRGEAYFEVAHLAGRPFMVHAGNRQITVLGTKFSVRRDGDKVTVSVLEGRVRVEENEAARGVPPAIISGGEVALARGDATLVTTRSQERVEGALAWRSGMLSFEQTSLSDVAAEFNRYNAARMIVTDEAVGSIRIGGVFPASKPHAFVSLLHEAYGIKVEETAGTIKISN